MSEPAQHLVAGPNGAFERVEVSARDPAEVGADQLVGATQAALPQLLGVRARDEGHGTLEGVLAERGEQAVRHGAVDRCFDVSLKAQPATGSIWRELQSV